jgi:hypothetical protein
VVLALQVDFRSRSKSMHALGQVGFQDKFETKKRRTKRRWTGSIIPNPNRDRIFCAASIRADKEQESSSWTKQSIKQVSLSRLSRCMHPGMRYLRPTWRAGTGPSYTESGFSWAPSVLSSSAATLLAGVHVSRLELRLGRAIWGQIMARSFGTTRSTTRHEIFWAVLARHEYEGHAVPRISARRATWPGPHLGPCLAGTARKWHVNTSTTIQYNFLAFTILLLI